MDYMTSLGTLAFASRMKRLSDLLLNETSKYYQDQQINFESRWFPLFSLILHKQQISVGEAAKHLNQSHVVISQTSKQMIAQGVIEKSKSTVDSRISILQLTQQGKETSLKLKDIWKDMEASVKVLSKLTDTDLGDVMNRLELVLADNSFHNIIKTKEEERKLKGIEIIDYDAMHRKVFYEIGKSWIASMFIMEDTDEQILSDPQKYVIDKGGTVILAKLGGNVVGSSALVPISEEKLELTKMGVLPIAKGKKVGLKLMISSIERARVLGARQIYLETNKKCVSAIALYKKFGFKNIALPKSSKYTRCDVAMQLKL